MTFLMKYLVLILTTTLIAGCGGGGGSGVLPSQVQVAPTISNLQYSPKAVYSNSGGGTATVSAVIDFSDSDGNISTFTISAYDSNNTLLDTQTDSIQEVAGTKTGQLELYGAFDTTVIGTFRFEIFLTDTTGRKSNTLSNTIEITEFPWKNKAAKPVAGAGVATSVNDIIYNLGGSFQIDSSIWNLHFTSYDTTTDIWTTKSSLPNTGFIALVASNGKIYGFGGYTVYHPIGGTIVEEYDPVSDQWSLKSPMPSERSGYSASMVNGKIYIIGGYSAGFDLSTVEVYDPVTDLWSSAPPMPTPRKNLTTAVANGKIYAIGGYQTTSISGYLSTVEEYNPETNSWNTKTQMPWPPRQGMSSCTINGKVYVAGGENWDRTPMNSSYEYDPLSDTWRFKESIPAGVTFPATAVVNNKLYVINDTATYEYTPANDINK